MYYICYQNESKGFNALNAVSHSLPVFYRTSSDIDPPDAVYPPAGGGSSYLDPLQQLLPQQSQGQTGVEHERSPIQNSPWKESSLDQPYQKVPKPQSACSSRSR